MNWPLGPEELVAELRGAAQVQGQQQQGKAEHRVEAPDRRAEVQHPEGEQNDGGRGAAADNHPHGGHAAGLAEHHPGRWIQGLELPGCLPDRGFVDRID